MSVKYTPVQWTKAKVAYDFVLLGMIFAYILIFLHLAPQFMAEFKPADAAIIRSRAFGSCAFLLLTVVLCLGPLARLDPRFLPLLYNRRHIGVVTFFLALTHAVFVLNWYFNFSPTQPLEALLTSNTSYGQLLGFPFESLGILALIALAILAATSHDFWLSFLTPSIWKTLHYLVYAAFALVVAHVSLGALQSHTNLTFTIVTAVSVVLVCGLHVAAALKDRAKDTDRRSAADWLAVAHIGDFEEGRARIVRFASGDRVAVFLNKRTLSAVSNACAHQNGPLGEGRIIDDCVTCPWHGFQYRLTDGCSPAPFTEKVPTYALKIDGDTVFVSTKRNAPGTYVEPLQLPEGVSA